MYDNLTRTNLEFAHRDAERRIAQLEKENAELKKEVEKHKWNDIFLEESAFYDKKIAEEYTTLQERIAELEKENAELKEKLNFSTQYYQGVKAKEQLTKAKEIIKMLHSDCYSIAECEDTNLGLWEDDLAKAEQFLKEE